MYRLKSQIRELKKHFLKNRRWCRGIMVMWRHSVVVITTAQLHLTMAPAGNKAKSLSSTIAQKQFIIIIIITTIIIRKELLLLISYQFNHKSGDITVNLYNNDVTNDINVSITVKEPSKVPVTFLASSLRIYKKNIEKLCYENFYERKKM